MYEQIIAYGITVCKYKNDSVIANQNHRPVDNQSTNNRVATCLELLNQGSFQMPTDHTNLTVRKSLLDVYDNSLRDHIIIFRLDHFHRTPHRVSCSIIVLYPYKVRRFFNPFIVVFVLLFPTLEVFTMFANPLSAVHWTCTFLILFQISFVFLPGIFGAFTH